ncbi:hypothetical protein J6590_084381 [Homalodisca vitripennis]|nr:hypothetical protein J6590_084381 [Homalodisca vitripennis]
MYETRKRSEGAAYTGPAGRPGQGERSLIVPEGTGEGERLFSCCRQTGVSVKTVLNGTRLLSGVKHRSSVSTVRYESSGPTEYIVESPLGPVNVPDMSLPAYIWKDFEEWSDKPAVVSKHRHDVAMAAISCWLLSADRARDWGGCGR